MTDIKVGDRIRVVRTFEGTVRSIPTGGIWLENGIWFNTGESRFFSQTFEVLERRWKPGTVIRHKAANVVYQMIDGKWMTPDGINLQDPPETWYSDHLQILWEPEE